ncbi:hypothetical protein C8J55DRAFT_548624 [Lentinula edodes]|uniref:Uncharacterized protein n=1 Tax=Lentinula lateritia TaxID=40482 RepID=A0A9W9AJ75_9AGAR|nr:hypothetical protein C8J55DRAFT_548624 [Lentinula edodes]
MSDSHIPGLLHIVDQYYPCPAAQKFLNSPLRIYPERTRGDEGNVNVKWWSSITSCPYYAGAEYHLKIAPGTGSPAPAVIEVKVKVLEVTQPITISLVLKVTLTTESRSINLPSTLVLKVYDRRYAKYLREFYNAPESSVECEKAFHAWASSGSESGVHRTLYQWERKRSADDELDIRAPAEETEAYLATLLGSYHENEITVYERLVSMQGNEIPRFFGSTRFLVESPEYVEGQRLDTFSADALSPALCFIVPSNPGVFGSPKRCREAVIIDFAQARLRWEDEDDEHWKRVKWSTDEEGAVGYVLQKKCGWAYQPTYRYMVLVED